MASDFAIYLGLDFGRDPGGYSGIWFLAQDSRDDCVMDSEEDVALAFFV